MRCFVGSPVVYQLNTGNQCTYCLSTGPSDQPKYALSKIASPDDVRKQHVHQLMLVTPVMGYEAELSSPDRRQLYKVVSLVVPMQECSLASPQLRHVPTKGYFTQHFHGQGKGSALSGTAE